MKVKKWLLTQLTKKEIIKQNNEHLNDAVKKENPDQKEELCRLYAGEEVEPPWVKYSNTLSPWELRHDYWLTNIWLVFWRGLDKRKQADYKKKWEMPQDWDEVLTLFWTDNNQGEIVNSKSD